MYEAYYGLSRRPFAATPDPGCWFRCGQAQAAIDELLVCAEQGQGIGILVAPAGTGKTLICERLIREIGEPFTSVLLRHATYNTRRGFLQTLLCELTQPYDKHTDQELRLGLAPVLKGLHQEGRALLLVVDEAHQLSESLLEELRILADQAEDGQPIVRLVLAGQFGLEDKLAHPALQALNQRIRAQVALESLTLAESADYIDFRITWGGGRTASVFTPEAVAAISRAADGVPRCLNQLCDHALLLGFASEQRPVTAATVAAALDDLRHLPLPWNLSEVVALPEQSVSHPEPILEDFEHESDTNPADSELEEVGMNDFEAEFDPPVPEQRREWLPTVTPAPLPVPANDAVCEEPVYDLYNALDAGLQPPLRPSAPQTVSPQFAGLPFSVTTSLFGANVAPVERLDAIQQALDAVTPSADESTLEIVAEVPQPVSDESCESTADTAVFEFGSDEDASSELAAAAAIPTEPRSCRNLFTRLRRKQQGR